MACYIASDRFGNYDLCHHGILGQKWGVRRFQNKDGSLTAAGKARYESSEISKKKVEDPHKRKGDHNELISLAVKTSASAVGLAATVGMAISTGYVSLPSLGASALGTTLGAGYLTVRSIQAGKAKVNEILSDKRIANAPIDKKTGLAKKTKEWSEEEDAKAINPGFKNFNSNTKNNCVLCSIAYDLRRRGFDVVAGKAGLGYTPEETEAFYKNAKYDYFMKSTPAEIAKRFSNRQINPIARKQDVKEMIEKTESALKKQGVGARGLFSIAVTPTNGHAIAYEVTSNGLKFFDCQSGKTMTLESLANMSLDMKCLRLDNLTPNYEAIKKNGVVG